MSVNTTNILQVTPHQLIEYINSIIFTVQVPQYRPNHQVWADECIKLLPYFAQCSAWCTEMYNLVYTAINDNKKLKKSKNEQFQEEYYIDLDSKRETLYRTMQSLDRMYEATSRILTGISQPNQRSRFES